MEFQNIFAIYKFFLLVHSKKSFLAELLKYCFGQTMSKTGIALIP